MIKEIIDKVTDRNILHFFQNKISSFKSEKEDYEYLLSADRPFQNLFKIGNAELNNSDELIVFSCLYNGELTARSSKKQQFDIAKKVLGEAFSDGAIFIFYDASGNFRFSFIRKNYGSDEGKYSNWRRFTYYVQPDKENKTFGKRVGDCTYDSLDAIQKAFSVEPLSREFYKDLSHWYFASFNEVEFPNDRNENEYNLKANAMIRLITRLIFVWFMKQKGLVPDGLFNKEKIDGLLNYKDNTGSTYYKAILQNLFFATLNTPLGKNRKWVTKSGYGVQNFYRYQRFIKDEDQFFKWMNEIPFLNGGLFENLDIVQTEDKNNKLPKKDIRVDCFSDNKKNESRLKVPDYLFFGTRSADISGFFEDNKNTNVEIQGIIDILNRYDFTIDENTPDDQEVALDPELLGTVFENLLASYNPETQSTARKESGSFYTPRPIVDYMVRESLEYYLADSTGVAKDKLKEIGNKAQEITLSTTDQDKIIFALSEIKILDPACGSGAFPMGCLQHIVQMLNRLDPDNKQWKAAQVAKLKEDLNNTIDQSDYQDLKENIDNIFSNRYNDADYARKLYLIQNCLYGVDIQPIAMQISKLRFFISLLVEQKIDRSKDNFGVIPLPNLETKFVAANTLLRLNKRVSTKKGSVGSGMFANLFVEEKEEELATVREKYFSARTPKTKRKWRAKDKTLRKQIADLLIDDGWDNDAALKIAHWDPFNQNAKADWFDPEWMFGVKKFDVVIGNPPYIQLQKALPGSKSLKYADLYKDLGYQTFERTGDIYSLFYEMGTEILQGKGVLSYITSNKWMRAKYGKSLRKYFTTKKPLQLIDLGPGVFEAATVDTNILFVQNAKAKNHIMNAFTLEKKEQIFKLRESDFTLMNDLSENSWVVLSPIEQSIKQKIEKLGVPLKDWEISINRGVLTGYNNAFIIDKATKEKIIKEDPKSAEIIRPILRGRDIKKYAVNFSELYLINTHNGIKETGLAPINIDDYPAIKSHLNKYIDKLEKRYDKGITPYNLRNCAYMEDFYKQKIIYQEIVQESCFTIDYEGFYFCNDTCRIIIGNNLEYLLSILNSKLFFYSIKKFYGGGALGAKGVRMKHTFFSQFCIPFDDDIIKKQLHIFTKVLMDNPSKKRKKELLYELDNYIFNIYNLNEAEIQMILNN